MGQFEHLLAPGTIGPLTVRNRIVLPPMHVSFGAEINQREIDYYAARAAGGAGLLITGTMTTCPLFEVNSGWPRVEDDEAIGPLSRLAAAVHAEGSLIAGQLTPGSGRVGGPEPGQTVPVSASATPWLNDPTLLCRPLATAEVAQLVDHFAAACRRLAAAGFDAVDVHSHTGYLVDQFLSTQWNQRTDEYGGSLENRLRFARELVAAARTAAPGLAVTFRLTVDHRMPGGRGVAESLLMAPRIVDAGVDLMMVDEGCFETVDWIFPPYYMGDAPLLAGAVQVKAVVDVPVLSSGNITPRIGEAAVADGVVDFIGMGRALIADPDLPAKLLRGQPDNVRPCIRCNEQCVGHVLVGQPVGCAVNPLAGFEDERRLAPAAAPHRVLVVGAGPAGLEAARVAALRGHTVDVYERSGALGGVLWPAAAPDFKRELRGMVTWWAGQLADLLVTTHLEHEITPDSPELATADEIVVATGSVQLRPSAIPGLDGPGVVDVVQFHDGAPVGRRVVVVGGGLSGADAALELAQHGHEVTIVEMAPEIAPDMMVVNRITLLHDLSDQGVRLLPGHTVTGVEPGVVHVMSPVGPTSLETDTVVVALGSRPRVELVDALRARGMSNVHPVGDCVDPGKVGDAVNAAYLLAAAL